MRFQGSASSATPTNSRVSINSSRATDERRPIPKQHPERERSEREQLEQAGHERDPPVGCRSRQEAGGVRQQEDWRREDANWRCLTKRLQDGGRHPHRNEQQTRFDEARERQKEARKGVHPPESWPGSNEREDQQRRDDGD